MSFHIFRVNEVYSNSDGTVQFIEFVGEQNNQQFWNGHQITSTNGVSTNTYNIVGNLSSSATNGKSVLVATQGFADLGLVTPDYIMPAGFLFTTNGTVNYVGMVEGTISYAVLPTDGVHSLDHDGVVQLNSPTNFAGASGSIAATNAADTLTGTAGADTLSGLEGNDSLSGLAGNDFLAGGGGNDSLDGGANDSLAGDTMQGGLGSDTYFVSSTLDQLSESSNQGIDTVRSAVSWTLTSNFENLILTGTSNIDGTGANDSLGGDRLTGNSGRNKLDGREGNDTLLGMGGNDSLIGGLGNDSLDGGTNDSIGGDTLIGGAGNDVYVVDSTLDKITEDSNAGTDTVRSTKTWTLGASSNLENVVLLGTGNINATAQNATVNNALTGNSGKNVLTGFGGNDTLDGGTNADTLIGGAGNDTYVVDSTLDKFTEASNQGTDTLRINRSWTLAASANIENLVLTGTGNLNGTGADNVNNALTGNSGRNVLNGMGGSDTLNGGANDGVADTLIGGMGNDTYVVDSSLDKISELGNGGIDTVKSSKSWTLGPTSYLENVVLLGTGNLSATAQNATVNNVLTGNSGSNKLDGKGGNDTLDGMTGADTLLGGDGNDRLIYEAADNVRDGGGGTDTLALTGNQTLNLGSLTGTIVNIERIDLVAGAGNNTFILSDSQLKNLDTDDANKLLVKGGHVNGVDKVFASGTWELLGDIDIEGQTYAQYKLNGATLQVDLDVERHISFAIELSGLNGTTGFRMEGVAGTDNETGFSVASAGDVNGDGYDDVIIGAAYGGGDVVHAGEAYVVFGKASGFASSLDLDNLGTNGFRLKGAHGYDQAGLSVASAGGDLNGDGIDDLLVGAPHYNAGAGYSGATYVVFGSSSGFGTGLDLGDLGTHGFRLDGRNNEESGSSVVSAGDVNGDGLVDLMIGSRAYSTGATYVVFGRSTGFGSSLNLSTLSGSDGFRLEGIPNDGAGKSVAGAGDVNGDGYDDVIIGAFSRDANGADSGESYVVFGKASGFSSTLDLDSLGTNGFRIVGAAQYDLSGISVASAGDVNGDGIGDLIIGAQGSDGSAADAGASYVVFGHTSGFGTGLNLSTLNGGNGFRIDGIDSQDFNGASVAGAGDVNGDGYDDLIIGAYHANPDADNEFKYAGESYVVFGKASGFGATLTLSALDGVNGFLLDGTSDGLPETPDGDKSGRSVASAGDVDGDGFADLIIGAPGANLTDLDSAGESYVIFGRNFTGTAGVVGDAGNNTLEGGGEAGVFLAGNGDDVIRVGNTSFLRVDGGRGNDTLVLDDNEMTFDLSLIHNEKIRGIETIDLSTTNSELVLTRLDVLALSDTSSTLIVNGSSGKVTTADGGWTFVEIDGDGYAVYTNGGATLKVDTDVNQEGIIQPTFALSSLDGTNGFLISGTGDDSEGGRSVASAGDFNGDGFADVIVGAPYADGAHGYVVFGKGSPFDAVDLSSPLGTSGFQLTTNTANSAGYSVASAGDVNGDGWGDLIIGARYADTSGSDAGESYVVFGKSSGFGTGFDLGSLGTSGFRLEGVNPTDESGISVASAGDVNGDGFDDLIIGAWQAYTGSGESYVVFGNTAGYFSAFSSGFDLGSLDGTTGFRLQGVNPDDKSGFSVASAGDLNGDGFDEVIIGAKQADPGGDTEGASYVLFGKASGFQSVYDLASLGTSGFRLDGVDPSDNTGVSVASAGDVNGDGYGDLIIGADGVGYAGASYVVFGKASSFGTGLDLGSLGTNGFRIDGDNPGDASGRSVASAGDVNGDGFDDLIIGSFNATVGGENYAGKTYVVFGKSGGFASSLDLGSIDGRNGFRLDGIASGDYSGRSVASAGDVNGDGFDDLIVGASGATSNAGESYVIFGRDFTGAVDFLGTAGNNNNPAMVGSGAAENFVGGDGNDWMVGGGGVDSFHGGRGDDLIWISDTGFRRIDGGAGNADTLYGGLVDLDLTLLPSDKIRGIEVINLDDTGADLTLNLQDLLDLSDTSNSLKVMGGESNSVTMVGDDSWDKVVDFEPGYTLYTLGQAKLLIDNDIQANVQVAL